MKFTLGVIVGAAVTAIVAHYLDTREGKALVDKIKQDTDDLGDNVSALYTGLVEKGKSMFNKSDADIYDQPNETLVVLVE